MIEHGSDGFFTVNGDWEYTYVSEEGARLADESRENIRGQCIWDVFPELAASAFEDALRSAMQNREAEQLEAYYPPHESWYDVRVYPTENGISIYFREVTNIRELDQQFEAIFNNKYTFMGLTGPDGTLIEANKTVLDFAGKSR